VAGDPITVVLVEDNDVFRESLELLLGTVPDLHVAAAVPDGRSALEVCTRLEPDVVLLDYRLPELDGVETTVAIGAACPATSVVVLTAIAETEEIE
jgi:DNA-binding NarL/FixJ family response regulator